MLKETEIKEFIQQDMSSDKKTRARKALDYYSAKHDILQSRMFYVDAEGEVKEDRWKSNVKISHPFFTELVDQQVQYMLSGDTQHIKSDIPELQLELDEYFNPRFYDELAETLTNTIICGFGYMYAVVRSDGKIVFRNADSLGTVEVRAKDTDDKCNYFIYWYKEKINKNAKTVTRVQVWDESSIHFYVRDDESGDFIPDSSQSLNPAPHMIYEDESGRSWGKGFGFIPFWRLDNNRRQLSGLEPIKELIDDYDLMACSLSNNLQDFTDALYVVSGFQGDNLDELIHNIKTKKHIGIDDSGRVDIKTIDIPHEARVAKLELDEKNIYRFGMGFNSAQMGDGNITNVVIKSRYALLDLKSNKLQTKLLAFLEVLVQVALEDINRRNGTDYQIKDVWYDFEREVITNAADNAQIALTDAQRRQAEINTILSLANSLDSETIIRSICDVMELDYEDVQSRMPAEPEIYPNQLPVPAGDSDEAE